MLRAVWSYLVIGLSLLATPLAAEEFSLSNVSLNGYGNWYYARTNENLYLGGNPDGSYRSANAHLSLAAKVNDKLRVVTQVGWTDSETGSESDFDYAFAEWLFSDRLSLRLGKAKMPFGIYSEIPFVGTLRPFLVLPQAAYGPIGFLGENYKGVALSGRFGTGFEAQWDLYGGGTELKEDIVPEDFLLGTPAGLGEEIETEVTRDVIGGRLVVETPLPGLSVGGSALTGREVVEEDTRRRNVYGVQAEYTKEALSVRSEYMHEEVKDDLDSSGSYLEVSYRLTDHWQAAAEVGRLRISFFGVDPGGPAKNLTEHDESALGLNYWFESGLVVKLNYFWVDGNLYSHPAAAELPAIMAAGTLHPRDHLWLAGAQFSF